MSTIQGLRQLSAAMAHEVRNPLNSMAIHAELMEGRVPHMPPGPEKDAMLKSIKVMQREIERIDRILEDYLVHAGPVESTRQPMEVATLLGNVVALVGGEAAKVGVQLSVGDAEDLAPWALEAEPFTEALAAILHNAILASRSGDFVDLEVSESQDHAEVIVRDRGQGIDPEIVPRLFHLGFSTWSRAGIGLTVAKQIIRGHGGSISLASEGLGKGTTVRVRVPLD